MLTLFEPVFQLKTSSWLAVNLRKHVTSMSPQSKPVVESCDTSHRMSADTLF